MNSIIKGWHEKFSAYEYALFCFFSTTLLLFFISVGLKGYISDSEIWSVTLAKNFGEEWYHPWVFTRPLFYFILAAFENISEKSVEIFLLAKLACTLNGLTICYLTFKITQKILGPTSNLAKTLPLFSVILLLSNSAFLNQGARIRSDLFGATLILVALIYLLGKKQSLNIKNIIIGLSPLLATPKTIFVSIFLILLKTPRKQMLAAVETIILLCVFLLILYPAGFDHFVNTSGEAFFQSRDSFWIRWIYLQRLVKNNPIFIGLVCLRTISYYYRLKKNLFSTDEKQRQIEFFKTCCFFAIILILLPEKVPFLIASFLPIFTIFSALAFEDFHQIIKCEKNPKNTSLLNIANKWALILVVLSLSLTAINSANGAIVNKSSSQQLYAINFIDSFLKNYPRANYYDVIGLAPTRASIRKFAGPGDYSLNDQTSDWLIHNPPDLIFLTNRMFYLNQNFFSYFQKNYFPLGNGIFARWHFLSDQDLSLSQLNIQIKKISKNIGCVDCSQISILTSSNRKTSISSHSISTIPLEKFKKNNHKILAIAPFSAHSVRFTNLSSLFKFDVDE